MRDQWERVARTILRGLGPRLRFALLYGLTLLGVRTGRSELIGCAEDLARTGRIRSERICRGLLLRQGVSAPQHNERLLALCLADDDLRSAEAFVDRVRRENVLMVEYSLWLAAEYLLRQDPASASGRLADLCARLPVDHFTLQPSPLVERPPSLQALIGLLRDETDATHDACVAFARLALCLRAFSPCAALMTRAGELARLTPQDRVVLAYSRARSGWQRSAPACDVEWAESLDAPAEYHFMLAEVALANSVPESARACLREGVMRKYAGHPELEGIVDSSLRIADGLACLPEALRVSTRGGGSPRLSFEGREKVFIAGFGWSGSGALHDALREYDGFREFPRVPPDRFLNPGADTEVTFIQSDYGLGRLWIEARRTAHISRENLWRLFLLHVIGGTYAGYSEYKSANSAFHLVKGFGVRYIEAFKGLFDLLAASDGECADETLLTELRRTTERLCELPAGEEGDAAILLNNAVFARNVDMVELFGNVRFAAVSRDPADMYVDRRDQDRNHWRSMEQFMDFHRQGVRRYLRSPVRKALAAAGRLVEVEFETFVGDAAYRASVLDKLAGGRPRRRAERYFFPDQSVRNVGVYRDLLSPGEAERLRRTDPRRAAF